MLKGEYCILEYYSTFSWVVTVGILPVLYITEITFIRIRKLRLNPPRGVTKAYV